MGWETSCKIRVTGDPSGLINNGFDGNPVVSLDFSSEGIVAGVYVIGDFDAFMKKHKDIVISCKRNRTNVFEITGPSGQVVSTPGEYLDEVIAQFFLGVDSRLLTITRIA